MRLLYIVTLLLIPLLSFHLYAQEGGVPPADGERIFLEKLRKDVATLTEKIKTLEQENKELRKQNIELAQKIVELNQTIKELTSSNTTPQVPVTQDKSSPPIPTKPIKGKILVVTYDTGKIVIKPGEEGGVQIGYKFNVIKDSSNKVATIEIEKVVDKYSIAKLVDGKLEDIKYGDDVEAILQKLKEDKVIADNPTSPNKIPDTPVVSGVITEGKYTLYVLNVGKFNGIKAGDKVLVQDKDKSGKCYLLVDIVEDDFSLARLDISLKKADIAVGDNVTIEKPKVDTKGLVRIKNSNLIAIDIGSKAGGKVGQQYEVIRDGQTVAEIVIKETYDDWSLVIPVEGSSDKNIQVGDQLKLKAK